MRETWHEHYVRMTLPEEMKNTCSVSFSLQQRLALVHSHLQKIFGDRANWNSNLNGYFDSEIYQAIPHIVKGPESIPEVSIDIIEGMINIEDEYGKKASVLIECLEKERECDADGQFKIICSMAEILGITRNSPDCLYRYLVNLNNIVEEEKNIISSSISANYSEFRIAVETLARSFIPGTLATYPGTETVMTQQKTRYYYRGENAFYGSSKASAYRLYNKRIPDQINEFVNCLRRDEGCRFLENFVSALAWPNSRTNYIALAQHYGLKTQMLDITSDIKAALFFACCTYDNGEWRPLKKEEFENTDSRPNISKYGGDSRYAMLYRTPTEITEMTWALSDPDKFWNIITPVGYQPFMRCSSQHAYSMFVKSDYDMYTDPIFDKFKIRLTEDICNWIFELAKQGELIYPHNDIPDLSLYFDKINNTRIFSRDIFEEILTAQKIPKSIWKTVENDLMKYGYKINSGVISFASECDINRINEIYTPERAMQLTKIKPVTDPMFIIGAEESADEDRK